VIRVAELPLWEATREQWLRSTLAVALLLLNLADVLSTRTVLAMGGTEVNPLSRWLIDQGLLAPVKVLIVGFVAVAAHAASTRRQVSAALGAVVAIYAGVVASNVLQILGA